MTMTNKDFEEMVLDIKSMLGDECDLDNKIIEIYIKNYSQLICNETCYRELPKEFYPYVFNATLESCQRNGHEGMASRSELGVSTSYSYKDIEESIRAKIRGKKNPRAYLGNWS